MKKVMNVKVTNFPKSKIEIFMTISAILSLLIAIISTGLYIYEINKQPNISLNVFTPSPILFKVFPIFH